MFVYAYLCLMIAISRARGWGGEIEKTLHDNFISLNAHWKGRGPQIYSCVVCILLVILLNIFVFCYKGKLGMGRRSILGNDSVKMKDINETLK